MKTILITGGTAGIGLALGRAYAAAGERVILTGRKPLNTLSDPLFSETNYIEADLAQPSAHQTIADGLKAREIDRLDLLIQNAGTGWYGQIPEQSADSIRELVQVNLKAPIALTHTLIPHLKKVGGKVVFVSSVVSVLPTPEYAVYTATKAALDGFARSLRIELAGQMRVQVLHPGATRTEMHRKIGVPEGRMDIEKFPAAEQVAEQMISAMKRDRPNVAIGGTNKLLRTVGRYFAGRIEASNRRKNRDDDGTLMHPMNSAALVTGFADGIGRELAVQLAGHGQHVYGIDVDRVKGDETARQSNLIDPVYINLISDVAATDAGLVDLPTLPIDILIHNAGISAVGRFDQLSLDAQMRVIDLNMTAPLVLTAELLRNGALQPNSTVAFLSSLSKFVGYPGAAVYSASKDGLASYAASLQASNIKGIRALVAYPGPTRTAHARKYSPDNSREGNRMPPAEVAGAIVAGINRGARRVLPGGGAKTFAVLGHLFPRLMEQAMKRVIFDKIPAGETLT